MNPDRPIHRFCRSRLNACALISVLRPLASVVLAAFLSLCPSALAAAAGGTGGALAGSNPSNPFAAALPSAKWQQIENSVDRALAWMASQQTADGSFPSSAAGQPAVTSLCVMAFLSRGYQPGFGPYGKQIEKAIDFVVACQRPDGLFSYQSPEPTWISKAASHTGSYGHAIAGLMLGEVYGHVTGQRMKDVKQAMQRALDFTRALQTRPKTFSEDKGGWRYLRLHYDHSAADSDMSVTSWQLMFLRSARNAEFEVPQKYIDDAMAYVHRSYNAGEAGFQYVISGSEDSGTSRGLRGAGIVSLSLAGQHQTPMALAAGDWLVAHPFRGFGETVGNSDRFFYSTFYCSQAAVQLGGRYFQRIFPPLADVLLRAQKPDGSWPHEPNSRDKILLTCYTTAMAVLSLTPAYQLLPVYQR